GATVLELDTDPETNAEGQGRSVAIAPDGKIVLGGWGFLGATAGTAAARLLAEPPRPLPIELLPDGTLLVTGTPSDDVVVVQADGIEEPGPVVRVTLNGTAVNFERHPGHIDFDRPAVRRVRVLGKAGGDRVTVDGAPGLPVHVDGGTDYAMQFDSLTVTGTEGPDAVSVGTSVVSAGPAGATVTVEGTEAVFLELFGGDDTVETLPGDGAFLLHARGGAGNDAATLRGRTGVVFTGGDGDDTHSVYAGWSQFDGGAGDDSAFFQGLNETEDRLVYSTAGPGDPLEAGYTGELRSEMSEDDAPVGPLFFEGLESLRVDLRGGDDRFLITGNLRTAVTVDGGAGNDHVTHTEGRDVPGAPTLQLTAAGLTRGPGYGPIATSGFESIGLQGVWGYTSVVVTPDEATRFEVFVDAPWPPEPPSPDNTVGVDLSGGATGVRLTRGPEDGSGTFEFGNRRPVVYRNFGTVDTVAARHVVYDAATPRETIAVGKTPLRPGQLASFANVTSYSKGINGAYLDVIGLPQDATPESVLASLAFHKGGAQGGTEWSAAPAPSSVSIARGEGTGGTDRIRLAWHDNALRNTWLRVTANGSPATGLTAPEQFYIGNLVGETGDSDGGAALAVTPIDFVLTRRALFSDAAINSRFDFNRDGRISPLDVAIVRAAQRNALPLFIAGVAVSPPPALEGATGLLEDHFS
ncbi:MAG TPA: hypothetical protein VFB66_12155, partial [Tepidisphaeraceae bacterium]|nr:hypothetical protein [Tepidisphaeraceae bacterium]